MNKRGRGLHSGVATQHIIAFTLSEIQRRGAAWLAKNALSCAICRIFTQRTRDLIGEILAVVDARAKAMLIRRAIYGGCET